MIFKVIILVFDFYNIIGSIKIIIFKFVIIFDGIFYKYFNGGWFDLFDWLFDFGGLFFNGLDDLKVFYDWVKIILLILIIIDFVVFVFDFVFVFMNLICWNCFIYFEEDGYDKVYSKKGR